jgi:hypothetical protein
MAWQFLGSNTLIWQPDTRVQAFPSGLVLVQRSAICRNTYLTTARGSITVGATLPCQSPSTESVKIFPAAQEIHERNGFVRLDVSGYGKFGDGELKIDWFQRGDFILPRRFNNFVLLSSVTLNPFDYKPVAPPAVVYSRTGATVITTGLEWVLESSDITGEFGSYREASVVFAAREIPVP